MIHRLSVSFLDGIWNVEKIYPGLWRALGLIVASAFAIYQFRAVQQDGDIARTLSYIERFEGGRVADSRDAVASALRPYRTQLRQKAPFSPAERNGIVSTLLESPEGAELPQKIDIIVDFYEGLRACVKAGICAASVATAYFASEASELRQTFAPYFVERKANNPAFGVGLEWFAGEAAKKKG